MPFPDKGLVYDYQLDDGGVSGASKTDDDDDIDEKSKSAGATVCVVCALCVHMCTYNGNCQCVLCLSIPDPVDRVDGSMWGVVS